MTVTNVNAGALMPYATPEYVPPTPDDIRAALKSGELTGSQAARLLGVSGRTVRKWTGGEQRMPYSAWRLLVLAVGLVDPYETSAAIDHTP